MIGILSWVVDPWVFAMAFKNNLWTAIPLKLSAVALHLVYSTGILFLVIPILEIHAGLISRNELAKDYTNDKYRVYRREGREDTPVHMLERDEYNEALDRAEDREAFVYSAEINPYDKGMLANCTTFWCESRSERATGDF